MTNNDIEYKINAIKSVPKKIGIKGIRDEIQRSNDERMIINSVWDTLTPRQKRLTKIRRVLLLTYDNFYNGIINEDWKKAKSSLTMMSMVFQKSMEEQRTDVMVEDDDRTFTEQEYIQSCNVAMDEMKLNKALLLRMMGE